MLRRYAATVLCFVAFAAVGAGLRPAPAAASISSTISSILQKHHVAKGDAGVYIWDFDAAQEVFASRPDARLVPASNMKLVTASSALHSWGPEHRFKTELYGPDVPVYEGVFYGDVYLRGFGDPSLSTLAYQRTALHLTTSSFEAFARRLRALEVRKIKGSVLGDESWFDKKRSGPWKSSLQLESGRLSALSGNESLDDGNRVKDPATYAARLLTEALRAKGIKVTGKPGTGRVPGTARLLKQQFSAPLRTLLKRMNKESDNFFAETLLKGLGRDFGGEGSTRAGLDVSRANLAAIGLDAAAYRLLDGCGLSYENRLTPRDLVRVLGAARQRLAFDDYYDALAIAGEDGTLEDRMRGTAAAGNAHAKTGSLSIAVCLSGYVTSANDHLVGFAILVNGNSVNWEDATTAEDDVVKLLAATSLSGARQIRVTPTLRQHPLSAFDAVNPVGSLLQAVVQP
ncbi:MAG: D-alanyl-D-alanine carboxypeptidase/D-alanyl-D-alanine-endopeptidase [Actinobacteria bacterium]|nr:D-alanyl-D-alanine carboxypeptidase/D-alanyl-D-alanine-endopeptidase [Actinomycetota bacterium]